MTAQKLTILSIDDDKDIRFALGDLFVTQGWHFVSASNISDGLRLFEQHRPDLVLLDYYMPGTSGL